MAYRGVKESWKRPTIRSLRHDAEAPHEGCGKTGIDGITMSRASPRMNKSLSLASSSPRFSRRLPLKICQGIGGNWPSGSGG